VIENTINHDKYHRIIDSKGYILSKYKDMYHYELFDQKSKNYTFNKKFNIKISSLDLDILNLKEVKSLPKELLALRVLSGEKTKFAVSIIPKSLLTLNVYGYYHLKDLSSLKNLKAIIINDPYLENIPKFPKSIEYISLERSGIGYDTDTSKLHKVNWHNLMI
jgi:hypothetical protein